MNWIPMTPELFKALRKDAKYVLAFNFGYGWSYEIAKKGDTNFYKDDRFFLLPKFVAIITEPEEKC